MTVPDRERTPAPSLVQTGRGRGRLRQQFGGGAESCIRDLIVSGQLRGGDFIKVRHGGPGARQARAVPQDAGTGS